jgi:hypothetical protein
MFPGVNLLGVGKYSTNLWKLIGSLYQVHVAIVTYLKRGYRPWLHRKMEISNYCTIADVDNQLPHYRCYMYCTQTTSDGFRSREALDISTCETPLDPLLSRLQRLLRDGSALWDHM